MANGDQSLQVQNRSTGLRIFPVRFRSKVQSAPLVSKDSAVPEVPPYQIPRHAMHDEIRTYGELQRQIHYALREQHPEWVEPDGDSPVCQSYERRFAELLALFAKSGTRSAQPLNC